MSGSILADRAYEANAASTRPPLSRASSSSMLRMWADSMNDTARERSLSSSRLPTLTALLAMPAMARPLSAENLPIPLIRSMGSNLSLLQESPRRSPEMRLVGWPASAYIQSRLCVFGEFRKPRLLWRRAAP